MAEERHDPHTQQVPARVMRSRIDRVPGQRDMSSFERVFAGPPAEGPRLQWAVTWPNGRMTIVDSEDDAIAIARGAPGCRIARRYVTPWITGAVPPQP
jgi:hypothetical protein